MEKEGVPGTPEGEEKRHLALGDEMERNAETFQAGEKEASP